MQNETNYIIPTSRPLLVLEKAQDYEILKVQQLLIVIIVTSRETLDLYAKVIHFVLLDS